MPPVDREFLTQLVIALCACIGGWIVLVKPSADELRDLQEKIEERSVQTVVLDHSVVQVLAARAPAMRDRCREIIERGAVAEDSSTLYGRITKLAQGLNIEVKNLRPGAESTGTNHNSLINVRRVDLTAEGEYEQIALFLGQLDEMGAYLRPVSVQFAPTKRAGGDVTVMQLGLEAVRFDLPEALRNLESGS